MMAFREKITWKTFVFVNAMLLAMYIGSHLYQKKRERELLSLNQFSEDN